DQVGIADQRAQSLIRAEIEELAFDYGSADAAAELMQAQRLLRVGLGVEEIARVERIVALEGAGRAVEFIRPRLQSEVEDRAGLPSVFRRRVLLRVELLNRVNRQDRAWSALHAFGVDHGRAVIGIVVVGAVHNEIVVFGAIAVGADRKK